MIKILYVFFVTFITTSILAQNGSCLLATSYGIKPDGITDNSDSLQALLNKANLQGNSICLPVGVYKFTKPLLINAGVSIIGAGRGSNATTTPSNGTILWYTGDSAALTIKGSNVVVSNLTVYNYGAIAKKGIKVLADSALVESVVLDKIQFYGFLSGTALQLFAQNHGGIAYTSVYDLRVRHAKVGIEIKEEDDNSFVNSNSFYHGVISGGGFDYAVLVNGGNNNVFQGTVIEPPTSVYGHIFVNKGQVTGAHIRVEASAQAANKPVFYFASGTSQSNLNGIFGGGLVVNKGNNEINMSSSKSMGEMYSANNLLLNSSFNNYSATYLPEFWNLSNTNVRLYISSTEYISGDKVLGLKVPAGQSVEFATKSDFLPKVAENPQYLYANYNVFVKTYSSDKVKVTSNSAYGVITSVPHSGSNTWETLGLQAILSSGTVPQPKVYIDNTSGTDTLTVELSSPSFNFGQSVPKHIPAAISTQGGVVSGVFTQSICSTYSFISGTNYLVLPKQGNYFSISGAGVSISRINHNLADGFLKGTVLTLLFANSGISVSSSAYISLKSSFTSTSAHTSLTLISNGDGTWREVNRNN